MQKKAEMGGAPRDGAQLAGPWRKAWWRTYHVDATEHLRQMSTLGLLLQGALKHAVGSSDDAWVAFFSKCDGVK